jgi:hypothetical protein
LISYCSLRFQFDIKILDAVVIVNPYLNLDQEQADEQAAKQKMGSLLSSLSYTFYFATYSAVVCSRVLPEAMSKETGQWFSNPGGRPTTPAGVGGGGVGKYLAGSSSAKSTAAPARPASAAAAVVAKTPAAPSTASSTSAAAPSPALSAVSSAFDTRHSLKGRKAKEEANPEESRF